MTPKVPRAKPGPQMLGMIVARMCAEKGYHHDDQGHREHEFELHVAHEALMWWSGP